jgi:hypothetical protein
MIEAEGASQTLVNSYQYASIAVAQVYTRAVILSGV